MYAFSSQALDINIRKIICAYVTTITCVSYIQYRESVIKLFNQTKEKVSQLVQTPKDKSVSGSLSKAKAKEGYVHIYINTSAYICMTISTRTFHINIYYLLSH